MTCVGQDNEENVIWEALKGCHVEVQMASHRYVLLELFSSVLSSPLPFRGDAADLGNMLQDLVISKLGKHWKSLSSSRYQPSHICLPEIRYLARLDGSESRYLYLRNPALECHIGYETVRPPNSTSAVLVACLKLLQPHQPAAKMLIG